MADLTFRSNRIYKNDLDPDVASMLQRTISDFASVKFYAYAEIVNRERRPMDYPVTLYNYVNDEFNDISIYLRNSAIQEANAAHKACEAANKLRIEILEERLRKTKRKIIKTTRAKADLQLIKDKLKSGSKKPFKKNSSSYKLQSGGSVAVTVGKGKNKKTYTYANLYDFEHQFLRSRQKQLKSNLGWLIFKRNRYQLLLNKLKANTFVPAACFGGKKLRRQSMNSKKKLKEWEQRRSRYFTVSGKNDSIHGNYVFNYNSLMNKLSITLCKQTYMIPNIKFPYGQNRIDEYYAMRAVTKGKAPPITYTVEDCGKYYIFKCCLHAANEIFITSKTYGVIGVDQNLGFYSVSETDSSGSLLNSEDICFNWYRKSSDQVKYNIEAAAVRVVDIALKTGKPIAIEMLKIRGSKKLSDYNDSKSKNFTRNMFAYHKMTAALLSRASKLGVAVYYVNPAYTSLIGKVKYMPHYRISVHQTAAYTIARRAMQFDERIPSRRGQSSWKDIYKEINKKAAKAA